MRWLTTITLLFAIAVASLASDSNIEDQVDKALASAKAKVLPTPATTICRPNPAISPVVQPLVNPAQQMIINYTHSCPRCGHAQYVVYRFSGAMHSHKCAYCGTEWWHPNR